jgi:excinuclease ABC subunit A
LISASGDKPGNFDSISGDYNLLSGLEYVDQNPIGKSSRSNPVTFMKAYDEIRKLYASQAESMHLGFTATHFSFNVDGGRCEECQGDGSIKVEMQFMADVKLVCESCKGMRFKEDVLEVKYLGKNIFDVLEMTVDEALEFFGKKTGSTQKKITEKIQPLADVGLGYIKLGQSSSTLSGGESQRVKLASFLSKDNSNAGPMMFIFDEPTTGLHFHDIKKLLDAFNALVSKGHSIVIIEHNLEIIKCADWIIDLGPEGGEEGGHLLFEGTPEQLIEVKKSYTAQYLSAKLLKTEKS